MRRCAYMSDVISFHPGCRSNGSARPIHEKAPLAWGILLGAVLLAAFGVLSMLNAAMLGAAMALLTGAKTQQQFEAYQGCVEKAKKARFYLRESRAGR